MFEGFGFPEENWSKLPHQLISLLPQINSLAEIKVIIYVLRHTWGYQEYDEGKRITLDEFMNGRKRRDGSRIDDGIGMSKNSVIDGIDRAVALGVIVEEIDTSNPADEKHYYAIRTAQPVQLLNRGGAEVEPPYKKETKETIISNRAKSRLKFNPPGYVQTEPDQNVNLPTELETLIMMRLHLKNIPKKAKDLLRAEVVANGETHPSPESLWATAPTFRDYVKDKLAWLSKQVAYDAIRAANLIRLYGAPKYGWLEWANNAPLVYVPTDDDEGINW